MITQETLHNWTEQLLMLKQLSKASAVYIASVEGTIGKVKVSTEDQAPYLVNTRIDSVLFKTNSGEVHDYIGEHGEPILVSQLGFVNNERWGVLVVVGSVDVGLDDDVQRFVLNVKQTICDQLQLNLCDSIDTLRKSIAMNYFLQSVNGVPWRLNYEEQVFIYLGNQSQVILGYSHDEWRELSDWSKAVFAEDRQLALDYYSNPTTNGNKPIEYRLLKKDGSVIWIKDLVNVVYDNDKRVAELFGLMLNITELKEKELTLVALNEKVEFEKQIFQTFIDAIPAFIFMKDLEGRLLIANKYYNQFFNQPEGVFVGRKINEFFTHQLSEELRDRELAVVNNKETVNFEFCTTSPSGQKHWFTTTRFPMFDAQNEVYAVGGSSFDITLQKENEQRIITLNNQLKHILQATDTILTMCDENGQVYYNSHEVLEGENELGYLPYSDSMSGNVTEGRKKSTFFYESLEPQKKTFQVTAIPFCTENGSWHTAEVHVDITQRNEIDQEMSKLRDQLEIAINAGQIAYIEWDIKDHTFKTNAYLKNIIGFDLGATKPNSPWLLSRVHPEDVDGLKELIRAVFALEVKELKFDFRFLNANQQYNWLHFNGRVSKEDSEFNPMAISGVLHDITMHKKLLNDLMVERNNSQMANQAKTIFLSNISHEIRTPMNAIIGFSDLLSKFIQTPPLNSYLDSIKSSGKMLLSLINDLLDVSKIEAGKMQLKAEDVNLADLIKEIVQSFELIVRNKSITLNTIEPQTFPTFIKVDSLRVRQIILNLVNNAVKFTHKGGVTIAYSFQSYTESNLGSLTITVTDTGIGINKEKQKFIFDSFFQDETLDTKKYEGTGLGLSIINKLVGIMNGKISLNSKVGEGSSFSVFLPSIQVSDSEYEKQYDKSYDPLGFNGEVALIVDDIESNRRVLSVYVSKMNLQYIIACSGEEAIALAKEHLPDIILMDIRMPVMDGFETLQHIKADEDLRNIPTIAISASSLNDEVNKIFKAGFDSFIAKPVLENTLKAEIAKFLRINHPSPSDEEQEVDVKYFKNLSEQDKSQINSVFISTIIPLWQQLVTIQPSETLALFSQELKKLTAQFEWTDLDKYQKTLDVSIQSFDFESIQKLILRFTELIDQTSE